MKRRAAREPAAQTAVRPQMMRVRVDDVYGGMIEGRAETPLDLLAASIARHGLLQPIVVRRNRQAGRYALVCGARRLAACRLLGLREIDAACLDIDEDEAMACFLEEHAAHVTPGPIEEAQALSGRESAMEATVLSGAQLQRRLRLLSLSPRVRQIVHARALTLEQAEPLLAVQGEERQIEAALIIAERSLTPAQARRLVFGPEDRGETGGRRRAVRTALDGVMRIAERMRAQGMKASVSVHAREGGMCVQLVFAHAQMQADQQEFEKTRRNHLR